jgi:hypothetical protein
MATKVIHPKGTCLRWAEGITGYDNGYVWQIKEDYCGQESVKAVLLYPQVALSDLHNIHNMQRVTELELVMLRLTR